MATHPSSGWRRTVGPQWSSVKPQGATPGPPPGMQQGFHSSYLNAISRPDLNIDHQQQQPQQKQQHQVHSTNHASASTEHDPHVMSEHQRALLQHQENQRQQQLYLQQLQLMQRLQAMPGSTTRPWYPTFGPAITTSCSDSTIQLDNPNQYTLINNAKRNRHAVGPHWRSIQTSTTYSPTSSPPSSSPQMQTRTIVLSSPLSTASTTSALHTYLSATYSSAASIDHARATSFHQQDQEMKTISNSRQALQSPVHQQYYQSHSYPHDPRHHLLHNNQPGNSREARDNLLWVNRASPESSPMTSVPRTAKRKATWQDEGNDDNDNDSDSGHDSIDESHSQTGQVDSTAYPTPAPSSSGNTQQSFTMQSSVQQFVSLSVTAHPVIPIDQDQEMGNAESHPSAAIVSSAPSRTSVDTLRVNQESMDVVESGSGDAGFKQTKRTKPRLDHSVHQGMASAVEERRLQSGEQVKNILQECFYNAATPYFSAQ
ncbi:hypothetical protein BC939DRAFT_473483 [Gamsiella multidivaricata]|uniref:uncharacterized protein n=1 Tax=Gamsiella multidivaricata TaxID=101098 RepID=UPI00221FC66C|nr:uncharacterized protein BC939DRAFT_473483 [Gamsiella multidivaricata]KAI7830667.1 hypothetical protein BC939DRAFT_473483 [Gamsiella multidivaricata]